MNKEEIKEILEEWKQFLSWCYESNDKTVEIHRDKLKYVIDYITNLQKKLDFMIDRNDEKQDRINKVIEYIKHENFKRNILLGFSERKYVRDILNNVLEILGDKENE